MKKKAPPKGGKKMPNGDMHHMMPDGTMMPGSPMTGGKKMPPKRKKK